MVHRIGGKASCSVGVTIAALSARDWDVRGRGHPPRVATIVACRAIRIAGLMRIDTASPAREVCRSTCMTGGAVAPARRDVIRIRRRALRSFGALVCIGTIVTNIAATRRDRRMVHRISRKACRSFGVTIAALDAGNRDMRWRGIARCRRPVVAGRAICVGSSMDISGPRPTRVTIRSLSVAGDAVLAIRGQMASI
jgi:hypothetical protein